MSINLPDLGGSFPVWGAFISLLGILAGGITVFIKGLPERKRAENEEMAIENAAVAARFKEFRDEVHGLKNELMIVKGDQARTDRKLLDATAVNRQNRDEMNTMMFLIRLLISEVKRLDQDPHNVIIQQAEAILEQFARRHDITDPLKSAALHAAEETEHAAEMTRAIAADGVEQVRAEEANQRRKSK